MHPKLMKVLAGLILFLSGAVTGFFGSRFVSDRGAFTQFLHGDPYHFAEMTLHRMAQDLDLSKDQLDKVRPIVMNTAKTLVAIRKDQEPKVHQAITQSIADIKPILTPEQLTKFEAIQARLKARRQAMERFGPPPPPPGFEGHRPPPPPDFDDGGPPPPPPDLEEGIMPPPHHRPHPDRDGKFGPPRGPRPEERAPGQESDQAPAKTPDQAPGKTADEGIPGIAPAPSRTSATPTTQPQ